MEQQSADRKKQPLLRDQITQLKVGKIVGAHVNPLSVELDQLQQDHDRHQRESEIVAQQLRRSRFQIEEDARVIDQLRGEITESQNKVKHQQELIAKAEDKLAEINQERAQLQARATRFEISAKELEDQNNSLQAQVSALTDQSARDRAVMENHLAQIQKCERGAEQLRASIAKEKVVLVGLMESENEHKSRVRALEEALQMSREQNKSLEETVKFAQSRYLKLKADADRGIRRLVAIVRKQQTDAKLIKEAEVASKEIEAANARNKEADHKLAHSLMSGLLKECVNKADFFKTSASEQEALNRRLESRVHDLIKELRGAQETNAKFVATKADIDALQAKYAELQKENAALRTRGGFFKAVAKGLKGKTKAQDEKIKEFARMAEQAAADADRTNVKRKAIEDQLQERAAALKIAEIRIEQMSRELKERVDESAKLQGLVKKSMFEGEKEFYEDQQRRALAEKRGLEKQLADAAADLGSCRGRVEELEKEHKTMTLLHDKYQADMSGFKRLIEESAQWRSDLGVARQLLEKKDRQLESLNIQLTTLVEKNTASSQREAALQEQLKFASSQQDMERLSSQLNQCRSDGLVVQARLAKLAEIERVLREQNQLAENKILTLMDLVRSGEEAKAQWVQDRDMRKAAEAALQVCRTKCGQVLSSLRNRLKAVEQQYSTSLLEHRKQMESAELKIASLTAALDEVDQREQLRRGEEQLEIIRIKEEMAKKKLVHRTEAGRQAAWEALKERQAILQLRKEEAEHQRQIRDGVIGIINKHREVRTRPEREREERERAERARQEAAREKEKEERRRQEEREERRRQEEKAEREERRRQEEKEERLRKEEKEERQKQEEKEERRRQEEKEERRRQEEREERRLREEREEMRRQEMREEERESRKSQRTSTQATDADRRKAFELVKIHKQRREEKRLQEQKEQERLQREAKAAKYAIIKEHKMRRLQREKQQERERLSSGGSKPKTSPHSKPGSQKSVGGSQKSVGGSPKSAGGSQKSAKTGGSTKSISDHSLDQPSGRSSAQRQSYKDEKKKRVANSDESEISNVTATIHAAERAVSENDAKSQERIKELETLNAQYEAELRAREAEVIKVKSETLNDVLSTLTVAAGDKATSSNIVERVDELQASGRAREQERIKDLLELKAVSAVLSNATQRVNAEEKHLLENAVSDATNRVVSAVKADAPKNVILKNLGNHQRLNLALQQNNIRAQDTLLLAEVDQAKYQHRLQNDLLPKLQKLGDRLENVEAPAMSDFKARIRGELASITSALPHEEAERSRAERNRTDLERRLEQMTREAEELAASVRAYIKEPGPKTKTEVLEHERRRIENEVMQREGRSAAATLRAQQGIEDVFVTQFDPNARRAATGVDIEAESRKIIAVPLQRSVVPKPFDMKEELLGASPKIMTSRQQPRNLLVIAHAMVDNGSDDPEKKPAAIRYILLQKALEVVWDRVIPLIVNNQMNIRFVQIFSDGRRADLLSKQVLTPHCTAANCQSLYKKIDSPNTVEKVMTEIEKSIPMDEKINSHLVLTLRSPGADFSVHMVEMIFKSEDRVAPVESDGNDDANELTDEQKKRIQNEFDKRFLAKTWVDFLKPIVMKTDTGIMIHQVVLPPSLSSATSSNEMLRNMNSLREFVMNLRRPGS